MIVTLNNNVAVPIHWNDRAWETDCSECGKVVRGFTLVEIKKGIEQHAC